MELAKNFFKFSVLEMTREKEERQGEKEGGKGREKERETDFMDTRGASVSLSMLLL